MQMAGEIAEGNQVVLEVTRMHREGEHGHGPDMVAYSFSVASWISRENF